VRTDHDHIDLIGMGGTDDRCRRITDISNCDHILQPRTGGDIVGRLLSDLTWSRISLRIVNPRRRIPQRRCRNRVRVRPSHRRVKARQR